MRVAFQIGGELRNWHVAGILFKKYKEILEQEGVKVDIFGTVWDSAYTQQCIVDGLFDVFTEYVVEDVPIQGIYVNGRPKNEANNTGKSKGLYGWSYACYKVTHLRKTYQRVNNIEYDIVVYTRPDVYIPYEVLQEFKNSVEWVRERPVKPPFGDFTIFSSPFKKSLGEGYGEYHQTCDDIKIIGDECAMDLFGLNFHLIYLNDDPSYVGSYHNIPGITAHKYGLELRTDTVLASKWHILRQNDGIHVRVTDKGSMFIEKEYLKDGEVKKSVEKLDN